MNAKKLVETAKSIATTAHDGQKRKGGIDYITHPKAVSAQFSSPTLQAIAWLHDVLEDNNVWTEYRLLSNGIP